MNLSESLRTLRRRWVLTLLLLVLVGGITVAAAVKLPKSYQSTATVALLTSKTDSKLYFNDNPYLAFDDSLNVAADVLGRRMMDPAVVSALTAQGYTGSYQVVDAPTSPGPVLIITVTDKNPAKAQSTLGAVTNEIASQLTILQSDVAPSNRISDTVLSSSLTATLAISKMIRPLAAVVVLGLVLLFGIPLIVEGASVRRRANRKTSQAPGTTRQPEVEAGTDVPSADAPTTDVPTTEPSPASQSAG